jgi:hypothetical protein
MHCASWLMIMNRIVLSFLIAVFFLSSCRSLSYFETPNALRNLPATLYLTNGRTYQGRLIIHTNRFSNSAVKLYTEGDKRPMRFSIHNVKGYELRNEYYALKEAKGGIHLVKEYSFMKRLTNADSKIHLYENLTKVSHPSGKHTSAYTTYETEYYLQLPNEEGNAAWPLNSSKFVPNFDEKMSKLVAACPSLAAKIANKEEGYFYAQVSLFKEKRTNVLMNIIDEYNACRK